ncbi:Membrane protein [Bosea sp. 62]|uniref:MgtC/SapB family protein n=2 Tax=Bosea TaxID=85413 RepID=UPI00125AD8ED|nr:MULTISPECIES: MgtC/SapB family protein [unclassified Bosea (in: a-proteobacteria)]CAD5291423.1 Membrane protein [Bosea sp. 21B]CAD5292567.1 Membrane protein [Bosea sp. 46]CAD5300107.1 Membrane protein [Bosea sp. 7B]VVT57197.1 Membrane protein [Bosea sp. EC-HK365B]VXB50878.1 Membrane protein [Bosea sp. 127]
MESLIAKLGLALAIGLLVGLERGWRERDAPDGARTAGIRTYAITGLLGGLTASLALSLEAPSLLIAGLFAFTAVFAWYKSREALHDADFSVTGVVAGMSVFMLGALAVTGDQRAAAAGGTALAVILASRDLLHGLVKRISWVELRAALVLAVMTAIILPLLPAQAVDPWGGFNPRQVWIFTVLTAAISYLGYIAVRVLGATRGVLVGGLAGAVVSSTAVTLALARTAAAGGNPWPLAGAATLAAAVSVLRVTGIVAIVAPSVLGVAGIAILAAVAVFAICGGLYLTRGNLAGTGDGSPRNPFELGPLLLFAVGFAVVSTISAAAASGHSAGMVATSAVSGVFDVDVAVLSALRLLGASADVEAVGHAVLIALATNAVGRLIVAAATGPVRFWLPLAGASALAGAAGAAAFAALPHFTWPGATPIL